MTQTFVVHAVGKRLPSGQLLPVAWFARELGSGQELTGDSPRFGQGTLVAFPAHRVLETLSAFGVSKPHHIIDLYAEYRIATNGKAAADGTADPDLGEACTALGVPCHVTMTDEEAAASGDAKAHCRAVVDAVCLLFTAMSFDRPEALRRGQYATAVAAMQERGIPIGSHLQTLAQEARHQLRLLAADEYPQCFRGGRWASKSAQRWLHSLRLGKVTPTLDWCRRHSDSRVQRAGEIAATLQKLEQLDRVRVDQDGRSRTDLRPYAAVSGRNQPRGYAWEIAKPLIQPPPGKALAIIDYCQQEFGIAAHLAQDPAMIADYYAGDAYLNFGIRAGVCSRNAPQSELRSLLKQAVLPIMYGASAHSLTQNYGIAKETARTLVATFDQAYPRCREWLLEARCRVAQQGVIRTVFGWKFHAPIESPDDFHQLLRTARNFPVQANGTEILWEACRRLHAAGIPLCGTLHDAILVESDADSVTDAVQQAEAIMQEASEGVLDEPLRTTAEVIRHGELFRCQQRFWSAAAGLLATKEVVCR